MGSDACEAPTRHIGLDEIQRGKGEQFWTVLSDVVHGEVIGLRKDRDETSATALLTEAPTARQRAAVTAVCTMHRPYLNAVAAALKEAEIVFDKFHVLQHASADLDEVRRQEFFRAGPVMREHDWGERWLLLGRWKTVRGSKRAELEAYLPPTGACSRPTCCASNSTASGPTSPVPACWTSCSGGIKALRWQRLPEMGCLGDCLFKHIEGIAAYCDRAVRFGVVESINTTIKAVLRRGRGMRDEAMLALKLKRATAHPIRSARDLARLLTAHSLYSNR